MRAFSFIALITVWLLPVEVALAAWEMTDVGTSANVVAVGIAADGSIAAVTADEQYRSTDGDVWEEYVFPASSHALQDFAFSETSTAIAVGNNGRVFRSITAGESWFSVAAPTSSDFYTAELVTDTVGYAAGEQGVLYRTTNGGQGWTQQTSKVNKEIYGLSFLDASTGWYVGVGGMLFHTANGGTWNSWISGTSVDLFTVHFFDAETGVVAGAEGTLRRTTDGGDSWETVMLDDVSTTDTIIAMEFVDDDGVFITEDGVVGRSTDAGVSWSTEQLDDVVLRDVAMSDAETIWLVGEAGYVAQYVVETESEETEESMESDSDESEEEADNEETETDEDETHDLADSLITLACDDDAEANDPCKAVYYYSDGGTRHAFPNERVFYTWYDNFDEVVEVSAEEMAAASLGPNVTYRPGAKMVTFVTTNTVYAVDEGAVLRAIDSEDIAAELYGSDWNTQIDDIADTFFGNYTFGDDIVDTNTYDPTEVYERVNSITDNL